MRPIPPVDYSDAPDDAFVRAWAETRQRREYERFYAIVADVAYQLWEVAGRPSGRDDEFWHMACDVVRDAYVPRFDYPAPTVKFPAPPGRLRSICTTIDLGFERIGLSIVDLCARLRKSWLVARERRLNAYEDREQ